MVGYILGTKRATRDLLVSKQLDFLWIFVSGLLDFCFLGAFCLYLVNQKSYRRLAGVKMTKVSMAFQIFQKIWILNICTFGLLQSFWQYFWPHEFDISLRLFDFLKQTFLCVCHTVRLTRPERPKVAKDFLFLNSPNTRPKMVNAWNKCLIHHFRGCFQKISKPCVPQYSCNILNCVTNQWVNQKRLSKSNAFVMVSTFVILTTLRPLS